MADVLSTDCGILCTYLIVNMQSRASKQYVFFQVACSRKSSTAGHQAFLKCHSPLRPTLGTYIFLRSIFSLDFLFRVKSIQQFECKSVRNAQIHFCIIYIHMYINSLFLIGQAVTTVRRPATILPYSSRIVHIHTSDHSRTPVASTTHLTFLQNLTNKVNVCPSRVAALPTLSHNLSIIL